MDIAQHEPTCRVRRHAHVHHLIAADERSLVELEATLATLPLCAAGRVFVEVPDASWLATLDAPARMVVTWLDRSTRRDPGVPGDALSRAATAWADEMLCDGMDAADGGEIRVMLLGDLASGTGIAAHLALRGVDPAAIRAITR